MDDAAKEFAAAMRRLGIGTPSGGYAAAVSGGGDSLALALLLKQWAGDAARVLALTVDHGLREGSRAEAEQTGETLKKHGIEHRILTWEGDKPATHIQERARQERYALLAAACRAENIPVLMVAHNSEDQMETFWMRLAHGSGLDGLAGMAVSRDLEGVRILRPLLGFTRAALRDVCKVFGAAWAEDPSNENEKFLRVRLRGFEDVLAGEGLTPQRLSQVLQKLEDARDALRIVTQERLDAFARAHETGFVTLDRQGFAAAPADIQRRMISCILHCVAPQDYPAGFEAIEAARRDMLQTGFAGRTIAGCDVSPLGPNEILFCRETAQVRPAPFAEGMVWDGRFRADGFGFAESLAVGALGEKGLADLRKKGAAQDRLKSLPFKVRPGLPALFRNENPVCVPHLSWTDAQAGQGLEKGRFSFLGRVKIV